MSAPSPRVPVIAIEEHYWDDELASHFTGAEASRAGVIEKRLRDFGGERIQDMDAAAERLAQIRQAMNSEPDAGQ